MNQWIETKGGMLVNQNAVERIVRLKDGGYRLEDSDGRVLGECYSSPPNPYALVPAAEGCEALLVTWYADGNVEGERRTIAAWRIEASGSDEFAALPVIPGDGPASNQTVLIIHPDGSCEEPYVGQWPSIESAIAGIKEEGRK